MKYESQAKILKYVPDPQRAPLPLPFLQNAGKLPLLLCMHTMIFFRLAKSKCRIQFIHLCVGTFPVSTLSCRYGMAVSWLTALVMTVVHDRVPDMAKYAKV